MQQCNEIINMLRIRLEAIKKELPLLEEYIKNAPEGHIRIIQKNNQAQYYLELPPKGTKAKYLKKQEINLAKQLAQKCYYEKVVYDLKLERNNIEKLLESYQTNNADEIYELYTDFRKALITPINIPNDEYARLWQMKECRHKQYRIEDTSSFYTDKNERVRSKSEILIANKLASYNIPYRYEAELILRNSLVGDVIYPDFTILNKRTRKVYYLEHLGMLDNQEYVDNNYKRILTYERNGIILGDNLLLTHETSNMPLDMRSVDTIIKKFLI